MHDRFEQFKKRKRKRKGTETNRKLQNLSPNELNHVAKMQNQSRDELEQIAKIRRIKDYERYQRKKGLIIYLLKSKHSLAEIFNNNLDNDKISDVKKIHNRLRDILDREYRTEI